ncbi:MAG TPA: pyridoxal phosphate-dependent aminotransferase family protein [Anaerolineae bacterium]|nr:pyridoxal phosphate-dependent aminotransferase family protein [Anaerolineae bacterium]
MDLFDKCNAFTRAREVQALGVYPYFIPLEQTEGTEVVADGRRLIMVGSNNYLGLTTHPKVRSAAIEAVERYGTSCTGSRFLNGTLEIHRELESKLAEFVGKEAALVFSTGFQVNLGTIASLVGRQDIVIADKEDHASIIDGCLLSMGELKRFRHNSLSSLDKNLESCDPSAGKLVVVDGVFSMGGDIAPLSQIVEICDKHDARLMVDDAHSVGVLGGGRGTPAHFGVTDQVDLIMGTFSKSFASLGGFIAGDASVIHFVQHTARSLIFSASMAPPSVAAALAALEVMQDEPERIERLSAIAAKMLRGFKELGFDTGASETPIIPVIIGADTDMLMVWKSLFDAGIYVNAVLPPAVPPGKALLRTSYMATHTDEQLDYVLDTFASVGRKMGII